MSRHRKTKLTLQMAAERVKRSRGARARSLAARHLLLHPNEFYRASKEEVQALFEYVSEKHWKSLYHHDRRMYKLLKAGARVLKDQLNIPSAPRPNSLDNVRCLAEVTKDLRDGTRNLSAKPIAELFGITLSRLAHWLGQPSSTVAGNPSGGFLQNRLTYLERIAWLRVVMRDEAFRKWLRSANPNLGNDAPLKWLDEGKLQNIVDLVYGMLTGEPT